VPWVNISIKGMSVDKSFSEAWVGVNLSLVSIMQFLRFLALILLLAAKA
jgi:hypothetical protein